MVLTEKIKNIILISLMAMTFIGFIKTCKNSSKLDYVEKKLDTLQMFQNGLKNDIKILENKFRRDVYYVGREILWDWNSIVRTIVRPDDRLRVWQSRIDSLDKIIK